MQILKFMALTLIAISPALHASTPDEMLAGVQSLLSSGQVAAARDMKNELAKAHPTSPEAKQAAALVKARYDQIESDANAASSAWSYETTSDEMGRGSTRYAVVRATDPVFFEFPYQGEQYARLQVRKNPSGEMDLMLVIDRGQFDCDVYACDIALKFDDAKTFDHKAGRASGGSSNVIFIRDEPRILAKIKAAKTLKIEASFYRQGKRVFTFPVQNLRFP